MSSHRELIVAALMENSLKIKEDRKKSKTVTIKLTFVRVISSVINVVIKM